MVKSGTQIHNESISQPIVSGLEQFTKNLHLTSQPHTFSEFSSVCLKKQKSSEWDLSRQDTSSGSTLKTSGTWQKTIAIIEGPE
jgi:hypothetical protein